MLAISLDAVSEISPSHVMSEVQIGAKTQPERYGLKPAILKREVDLQRKLTPAGHII